VTAFAVAARLSPPLTDGRQLALAPNGVAPFPSHAFGALTPSHVYGAMTRLPRVVGGAYRVADGRRALTAAIPGEASADRAGGHARQFAAKPKAKRRVSACSSLHGRSFRAELLDVQSTRSRRTGKGTAEAERKSL